MNEPSSSNERDPIAEAFAAARRDVQPIDADALVAAARTAKEQRTRRRRRVTGSTLGVAAALILVTVAAVAFNHQPSRQVTTAKRSTADVGMQAEFAKIAGDAVTVTPATGLVDGQTVSVVAHGFDAGSTVLFVECAPIVWSDEPHSPPSVHPGGPIESAPVTPQNDTKQEPMNPHTGAAADGPTTMLDATTGSDPGEAGVTPGSEPGAASEPGPTQSSDIVWRCADQHSGSARQVSVRAQPAAAPTTPKTGASIEDDVAKAQADPSTVASASLVVRASGADLHVPTTDRGSVAEPAVALPRDPRSCGRPWGAPTVPIVPPTPGSTASSPTPDTATDGNGTATAPNTGSGTSATTASPPDAIVDCVIIAIGTRDGAPIVLSSQPLSFGTTSTSPPQPLPNPTDPTSVPPATGEPACEPGPSATPCPPDTTPAFAPAMCPNTPKLPPLTGDRSTPLLDFTPTSIVICHQTVSELGPPTVTITDQPTIDRIVTALAALDEAPDAQTACTAEMSDSMVLTASNGTRSTSIVAQFYGCGMVSNGVTVRVGAKGLQWINALPGTASNGNGTTPN